MTQKQYLEKAKIITKSILVLVLFGVTFQALAVWTAPGSTPPGGNTEPPINVGGTGQSKTGALIAGGLRSDTYIIGVDSALFGALAQPNDAAVLELRSKTKGFLPPRMTMAERNVLQDPNKTNASLAGLLIYQTDNTPGYYYYNGTTWVTVGSGGVSGGSGNSDIWTKSGTNIYPTNVQDQVGIGTASPTEALHVSGNLLLTGVIKNSLGTVAEPSYSFAGDLNTGISSSMADTINFSTNGVNRLTLDSNGNLTIASLSGTNTKRLCVESSGKLIQCPPYYNHLSGADRVIAFSAKVVYDVNSGGNTLSVGPTVLISSNDADDLNKVVKLCNISLPAGLYKFRAHYDVANADCNAGTGLTVDSINVVSAQLVLKDHSYARIISLSNEDPASLIEAAIYKGTDYSTLSIGDEIHFMVAWPQVGN